MTSRDSHPDFGWVAVTERATVRETGLAFSRAVKVTWPLPDLSQVVDDLWERIGAKARKQGVKAKDVDRIIRETRASR